MSELILALNAGSSSIKLQAIPAESDGPAIMTLAAERIGDGRGTLRVETAGGATVERDLDFPDHLAALEVSAARLKQVLGAEEVRAVSHRVVHGGGVFSDPVVLGPDEIRLLTGLVDLAPLHLPACLAAIDASRSLFGDAIQVGCFDTGFHSGKPAIHDRFALPREIHERGVRRYGFHGLSCQSILRTLRETGDGEIPGRLVIAHLGNGCSVTAVRNGRAHSSSMGFSTLDGVVMGTRCGRIDPGALLYLLRHGMTVDELETLLYRKSGLLGLSGLSNDMRDLEASGSAEAREAVDCFVSSCVQEIARAAATLGGVDLVVFCGGIGENATGVRTRIVDGLRFLGDAEAGAPRFRVVRTNEERELAIAARALLGRDPRP